MSMVDPGDLARPFGGGGQRPLGAVAAGAVGVVRAMSGNDDANHAMVAVNRSLGYLPFARPTLA